MKKSFFILLILGLSVFSQDCINDSYKNEMQTANEAEKKEMTVDKVVKSYEKVQNLYVHSIELKESENDTIAAISLKEGANYYTARQGHLEPAIDDFPFVEFAFINKIGN